MAGWRCVIQSLSGGFAGGGAEKTPAGDYSVNTLIPFGTGGGVLLIVDSEVQSGFVSCDPMNK
jgi:hypothetical protein